MCHAYLSRVLYNIVVTCMRWLPYSGKFSLVQNFTEMHPDSSEEIFMDFIFAKMCHTLTTPLYSYYYAPHGNWRNDTERLSEEASMYNNALVFFLCGGLCNYESNRTATVGEKLGCWIQHCWFRLRQPLSFSYGFVGILYSIRLILRNSDHLNGR